jgi:hypothetical protein
MRRFGSWELLEVRRLLAADGYHYSPPAESEVFEGHEVSDTAEESPDPQLAGSLTGFKFLDANRDRVRNVGASSDSLFVLLLDASESSRQPFGVSSYSRLEAQSIAIQEFQRELVRRGLAIAGRLPRRVGSAFQDVGDVNRLAGKAHCLNDPGEKLSGLADEWFALDIFVNARRLANEHQWRLDVADTKHDILARAGEVWAFDTSQSALA